jgi:hypothetical protein
VKIVRLVFALAFLAGAQDILTNESVVKMAKPGLGENLIVSVVQGQPGKYSLKPRRVGEAQGRRSV